mgnify:CR=1 FL=1
MRRFTFARNIWIVAGLAFLVSFFVYLFNEESMLLLGMSIILSILSFLNAYVIHKRLESSKKEHDDHD